MQVRAVSLFFLVLLVLVSACERQTQYTILTTIFTGVPPMEELYGDGISKEIVTEEMGADKEETFRFQHPLWAARNCAACHTAEVRMPLVLVDTPDNDNVAADNDSLQSPGPDLLFPPEKLCINCHRDKTARRVIRDRLWLHQPVARGNCLACHAHHESSHPDLLRIARDTICLTCHKTEQLPQQCEAQATGKKQAKSCLKCHNSHMGRNRNLLTEEYQEVKIMAAAPAAPATPAMPSSPVE